MKLNKLLIFIISASLTACITTSNESLLEKDILYTKAVNKNYLSLGKCIKDKFSPIKTTYNPVYISHLGSSMPLRQSVGIETSEDKSNKVYYINDFREGAERGPRFKIWIISIKSLNQKDSKSEIKVQGTTVFGKARFGLPELEEKISQCI